MSFLDTIIPFFVQYKYLVILPVAVVEGPVIAIVGGFLISLGYLNYWLTLATLIVGDMIGDSIYYVIGRFGRMSFITKHGHYIGLTLSRIEKIERHFARHPIKTLFFGKFAHGLASITWVAAGMSRVPYRKFIFTNMLSSAIKSGILLLLGFYYGKAYTTFDQYLGYIATGVFILFIGVYLLAIKTNLVARLLGFEDIEK